MTRRRPRRAPSHGRLAALLAALGVAAAVASCGGGGGGGGGGGPPPPPPPPQPQPAINFTGDPVAAPAVRLVRGPGSTATVLELEVRADQLPGVYALAFDLTYPSAALSFDAFAEGSFLDQNGAVDTSLQVAEPNPGRLVVGHSRLGEVGAVAGSGLLMTLRFDASGAGAGEIAFERNRLFDQRGVEVRGASWAGGTVEVIP